MVGYGYGYGIGTVYYTVYHVTYSDHILSRATKAD